MVFSVGPLQTTLTATTTIPSPKNVGVKLCFLASSAGNPTKMPCSVIWHSKKMTPTHCKYWVTVSNKVGLTATPLLAIQPGVDSEWHVVQGHQAIPACALARCQDHVRGGLQCWQQRQQLSCRHRPQCVVSYWAQGIAAKKGLSLRPNCAPASPCQFLPAGRFGGAALTSLAGGSGQWCC